MPRDLMERMQEDLAGQGIDINQVIGAAPEQFPAEAEYGVEVGVSVPPTPAAEDGMTELATMTLTDKIPELMPMITAASSDEVLAFVRSILDVVITPSEEMTLQDEMVDATIDGSTIPEGLV